MNRIATLAFTLAAALALTPAAGAPARDLPAYRFRPPVSEWLAGWLPHIPEAVIAVCVQLDACSAQLKRAFEALDKDEKLLEPCIEINRIEEEVDVIVRRAVKELFENEKDPMQVIKLKEVYDLLEQTTDYCEDVADALQNVIVKNS